MPPLPLEDDRLRPQLEASDAELPRDVYLHAVREDRGAARPALPRHRARRRLLGRRRPHAGARSSSTCRRSPSTTSPSRPTTWWWAPTAARSGSSTTSRRCARWPWRAGTATVIAIAIESRPGRPACCRRREAVRWAWTSEPGDRYAGDNPPAGAPLYYWLEDEPKGEVTLEIRDAAGTLVRRALQPGRRADAGLRVRRGGARLPEACRAPQGQGPAARRLGPRLGRRRDDPGRHPRLRLPGRRPDRGARHLHRPPDRRRRHL